VERRSKKQCGKKEQTIQYLPRHTKYKLFQKMTFLLLDTYGTSPGICFNNRQISLKHENCKVTAIRAYQTSTHHWLLWSVWS
jgi:hypothetical protein